MYEELLEKAGLLTDEAAIYEVLLKNGRLPAGKISKKSPLKRGLVYKVLGQLSDKGLVLKKEAPGKAAVFEPAHPLKLREFAERQEQQAKDAQMALGGVLGRLVSDYNLISGKPGVHFFEGFEGMQRVYDFILEKRKPLKILASNIDRDNPRLTKLIEDNIKKQHALGITVQAIGSASDASLAAEKVTQLRAQGIEIKKLDHFEMPSQIIVFGSSVAISALTQQSNLLTTYIESAEIASAFETIFTQLWLLASLREAQKSFGQPSSGNSRQ